MGAGSGHRYVKAVADAHALPDAVLVADRFHLVRFANDMLTGLSARRWSRPSRRRGGKKGRSGAPGGVYGPATSGSPPSRSPNCAKRPGRDRRPRRPHPARLHGQGEPAPAARPRRYRARPGRDQDLAMAVLHEADSSSSPEVHRLTVAIEVMVGRRPSRDHHRVTPTPDPRGTTGSPSTRPQRLRLSQCRQPAPKNAVGVHWSIPTRHSRPHRDAGEDRGASKTRRCGREIADPGDV
jgi:hypothetical protein